MSIHLTIDEMLEIIEQAQWPSFSLFKQEAEDMAINLAHVVQAIEPRLVWSGRASREPLAFVGTCATFSPRESGPVPGCLLDIDVEVEEWLELSDALLVTQSGPYQDHGPV